LCLLNFQKTRPLQVFIGAVRIFAVLAMIGFMLKWLFQNNFERVTDEEIPLWNMAGIPSIFGNGACTFMVHHSIPGLVFPLKNEKSASRAIAWAYAASFALYVILCLLALLAFNQEQWKSCPDTPSHPCSIQHLFNMNFASLDEIWAAKFIVLYPVLVVSVFPLVAITLRNNLKTLLGVVPTLEVGKSIDMGNLLFTILTVGPPFFVAFFTRDVQIVMKYIGGYFGFMLMFLVPSLLVLYGRRQLSASDLAPPHLTSPFRAASFVYFTLAVFLFAIVFNSVSLSLQHMHN